MEEHGSPSQHRPQSNSAWIILLIIALMVGVAAMNARTVLPSQPHTRTQPEPAPTGHSIYGKPTISVNQINTILRSYHSPAAGKGQALYDGGIQYGIDPAWPLAFFLHESAMGTQGMARATLALGNERCLDDRPCINTLGEPCQPGQSCYAQFFSWEDGFTHWYQLLSGPVYKGCDLTTIETIIPKYAPAEDANDEQHYISVVTTVVRSWQEGAAA